MSRLLSTGLKKQVHHLDMARDECPVIARSGADPATVKKQLAKLRRVMAGIPLGADPGIELKKTRNRRGLV